MSLTEAFVDTEENHDFSSENQRRSFMERLKQGFGQAIDKFLCECGSELDGYKGQCKGQSQKFWLLRGIDAYINVIDILLSLRLDSKQVSAEGGPVDTLLSEGRKAFCAAFQWSLLI